ncbi:hypothetical protein [Breoghania sp.]|uniref:hypothetical protein n=1 Tax=Breoghania sp. TaxID=2065378 RepID=UPI002AABE2BB|nr:hypothetical protein [Breoghania sp.]
MHESSFAPDAIALSISILETTRAWGIGGGITHHWTPTLSSAVTANYASYSNDLSVLPDAEVTQWSVQGNQVWSPVSGSLMGVEREYQSIDGNTAANLGGISDDDDLVGVFRVPRTF